MKVAIAAVLGLAIGHVLGLFLDLSYSNGPLSFAPRRCNGCRASIRLRDFPPLLGYLVDLGRCECGRLLAPRTLLLPVAAAALFAAAVQWRQGWSAAVLSSHFGLLFVALLFTDLERRLIPNRLVYPGLALAGAVSWLWPERAAAAAFAGGGLALATTMLVYLVSRGGFGAGDVKMAFLMGLVVGYPAVVVGGFVAALSAGLVSAVLLLTGVVHRRQYIPYGPFIAIGGLVALFWGT